MSAARLGAGSQSDVRIGRCPSEGTCDKCRTRFIFFEKGKAIGADLSQADGSQHFHSAKRGDVYHVEAGNERYEIVEAFVFGG